MRRVTIREVAKRAGVSYQTVSRVINNSPEVAEATRAQVQRTIAELNYHPNAQAVSLSRNRSDIVGMIVNNSRDAFFAQIIDGACQALSEQGRFMLLALTDSASQPETIDVLLQSRRIDGIIIVLPLEISLEHAARLVESRLPLVLVDFQYDLDIDHIAVDNFRGAYEATEHLINLGHRRIGIICGRRDIPVGQVRLDGYCAALEAYGIPFDPALVAPGDFSFESGSQGMEQLLAVDPRPTAVFACDDPMAFGALRLLHQRGLRVPQDISIIGFDDIPEARHSNPPLTTIRQPLLEMGRIASEFICRRIDGELSERLRLVVPTSLVERDSTARLVT